MICYFLKFGFKKGAAFFSICNYLFCWDLKSADRKFKKVKM